MSEASYLGMLRHILHQGTLKEDRTETGTRSVFGYQLRFDMRDGFPLMTTKYVDFKNIVVEMLWFLSGSTNIKSLVDQDCNIWVDWPLKRCNKERTQLGYEPLSRKDFIDAVKTDKDFAENNGDLGPVYGSQWRAWPNRPINKMVQSSEGDWHLEQTSPFIDQIKQSVAMLKKSPDSRRNLVSAWNVADIEEMAISGLPPCHFAFQWNTRPMRPQDRIELWNNDADYYLKGNEIEYQRNFSQKARSQVDAAINNKANPLQAQANLDAFDIPQRFLDIHVNIRSWDTFLGGPYNIAEYALLLHMFAQVVRMAPGHLIISSGDTHIYSNHFEAVATQLCRERYPFPKLKLDPSVTNIDNFELKHFTLEGYKHHPPIKGDIAV